MSPVKLSFEDICWVQAIADRWVLFHDWSQEHAYKEALAAVEGFYQEQLDTWGWYERDIEIVLRTKRLDYEKETRAIQRQRELDARTKAEREAASERYRKAKEERLGKAWYFRDLEALFIAAGGRDIWIVQQRLSGRTLKSIAEQLGLHPGTISGICGYYMARQELRYEKFLYNRRDTGLGRPLDMGGPRDVWLTYYPPPDPRLDNMEPV